MKKIRMGCGSASWGDMLDPAVELMEKGELDYMGFDHLAELTMSILQRMKDKNPKRGYIPDLLPWMRELLPIAKEKGVRMLTNAGGANPEQAGSDVLALSKELGIEGMKIRVEDTLAGQRVFLQEIAVDELQAQKDRLNIYMIQARFALAAIYDAAASSEDLAE